MIDNQTIINFKKIVLSFEDSELTVATPIDPLEGHRYIEPVNSEGQGNYLDHLYNMRYSIEDYINPMADGNFSWRSVSSCTCNSGDALENWKNKLREVSMRRCTRITRSVRRVGAKESEFPKYEGLPNLASFLLEFEEKVTESQ